MWDARPDTGASLGLQPTGWDAPVQSIPRFAGNFLLPPAKAEGLRKLEVLTELLQKGCIWEAPRWHHRLVGTAGRRLTVAASRLIVYNMASPVQIKMATTQ
jgi:hypothetical protein